MNLTKTFSDDYFRLFVKREGKVVLGRRLSNLWLLTAVLTATFLAIAFSNASMKYLSDKMNDPFIRWMDIPNAQEGKFRELENALYEYDNMDRFDYESVQADYYQAYFFAGKGSRLEYFRCRFFSDMQTDLIKAILADDNVVGKAVIEDIAAIPEDNVGVILTGNAVERLGYDEIPTFVDLAFLSGAGADSLGFELLSDGQSTRVPLPVLAVVKRLPSNVDIVGPGYLFRQEHNDNSYPFNLAANSSYARTLNYFVPAGIYDEFGEALREAGAGMSSVGIYLDLYSFYKPELTPFVKGDFITLRGETSGLIPAEAAAINDAILEKWGDKGVFRVYDYNFSPYSFEEKSYLSVYFNSLDHVREFESYVNENFHIRIDMSQVNSKENFNAVSIMAGILSWAIIVFALICIILFIVNLLQSYFQKVKRNIGTFKAFGVSNRRLISVYVLIVGATIAVAIAASLLITLGVQGILGIAGVLKDGTYPYFSLWSSKTIAAILIVIAASLYTVYKVMARLLRQTPGDLIYDRQ